MIDLQSYRHLKSLPIDSIYGEVIRHFCDTANIKLWSLALTPTPAPLLSQPQKTALEHYQAFVKTMSELAQAYAEKNCGLDPSCQFASFDLEFALKPERVAPLMPILLEDMTEGDRRRVVTSFLKEGVDQAQASRQMIKSKDLPL